MGLSLNDIKNMKQLYEERYKIHGYDPKTLGWYKGKQKMRFSILTSQVDLEGLSLLDIGCGFGDLNYFLKNKLEKYKYHGIDCSDVLIAEAINHHPEKHITFAVGDYLAEEPNSYDYIIGSGIFNFKFVNDDNYSYINSVLEKSFSECRVGVAFDFLSDKVDFKKYDVTFHSNPSRILDFCYKLTRNVVLRNDYAPFEFSIFLFKDDKFDPADTVFSRFKSINPFLLD